MRILNISVVVGLCFIAPVGAQKKEPQAYTVNCKACHLLNDQQVGPSLVEMSEIYPQQRKNEFIKWCINPGKKRPEMPQMPSMAHIPKDQLEEIHAYILDVSKGLDKRVRKKVDEFKESPAAVARPRVVRTFLPNTGPASILLALPTSQKHNVVWDTDQCRVRYISTGEIDNYPYLRGNGNSLAKEGNVGYTEEALFTEKGTLQYRGYQLDSEGYVTLHYTLGETKLTEKITSDGKVITRTITATPKLPTYSKLKSSAKLLTEVEISGNILKVTHTPR